MAKNGKDEAVDTKKGIRIVVNGTPKVVSTDELTDGDEISYNQVLVLYGEPIPEGPDIEIKVFYTKSPNNPSNGELKKGEVVKIQEETVFYVRITDNS